jgi:hypothetical protein
MAEAVSTAFGGLGEELGEAQATAKTSFRGVSVQSMQTGPSNTTGGGFADAIAEGGSAPAQIGDIVFDAIATALPDKAYATALIGGASNVANALLGPRDEIFGTAILLGGVLGSTTSSTFDFSFRGDLLLGVIDGSDFEIIINGVQIFSGGSVNDAVINLGSNFGPNIDLTIDGFGAFVIGGVVPEAVPEPSTWAMMLLGFAGLGYAGYRRVRRPRGA